MQVRLVINCMDCNFENIISNLIVSYELYLDTTQEWQCKNCTNINKIGIKDINQVDRMFIKE